MNKIVSIIFKLKYSTEIWTKIWPSQMEVLWAEYSDRLPQAVENAQQLSACARLIKRSPNKKRKNYMMYIFYIYRKLSIVDHRAIYF